jgi:beta-glucosidase
MRNVWLVMLIPMLMPGQDVGKRVDDLLGRMTLEEKIGQLAQLPGMPWVPGAGKPEDRIRKGQGGSVLWLSDPKQINKLQHIAMDESRLKIPVLFGLDVIHGYRTIFPIPLAMAASWDPSVAEHAQTIAAREAAAVGIRWTFAPMLDIARDPRWGRIMEGAGEDPYLGSAMAKAQVRGFQGDLNSPYNVLACAKHFAGYGAAEGGRDYDSAFISEDQLWNVYLPPFRAALDAGVATVMSAYMDLNNVPATANRFLLQDVLRGAWNFQGFVVSDAMAVKDLVTHGFARDARDAAFRGLTAGINMDMASGTYLDNLPGLVDSGRIPVATIDAAVRPILAAKFRMGLFEHPYVDESRTDAILNAPEHRQAARIAAQKTAVLLRNEGQLLPLSKTGGKSIAVIGPFADSGPDLLSFWAPAGGDPKEVVTVVQGIRAKVPGARVEYAPGADMRRVYPSMFEGFMGGPPRKPWSTGQSHDEIGKAVALASRSDIVVLTAGELPAMSGEMASQSSLSLPGRQQELMEAVAATGKPIVLVLINGRPLNLLWASGHIPAILEAWHPGVQGGNAIADLLFGDATPGGKLPVTWPRNEGQIPIYYAHNLTHQPDFNSRYWDEPSSPLYPFGFGLSYTNFFVSNLRLSHARIRVGETLEVSADVANTGSRPGDEVVQLYIHQQAGSASRPVRELKGFERVTIRPGEKKTVKFTLGKDELTYWSSQERKWVLEAEKFDVWVGQDSTAKLHESFEVVQ